MIRTWLHAQHGGGTAIRLHDREGTIRVSLAVERDGSPLLIPPRASAAAGGDAPVRWNEATGGRVRP